MHPFDRTAQPPTPAVVDAARLLAEAASRLGAACTRIRLGYYEADTECRSILLLAMRNVEAVTVLAARDLVLLPAAMVAGRTAFEFALLVQWMLHPDDPLERETRWLAYLHKAEDAHARSAKLLTQLGLSADGPHRLEATLREFRVAVEGRLPAGYTVKSGLPTLREMLEQLGACEKYLAYIHASQFAHGSVAATQLYGRHLGAAKEFGEFVDVTDWQWPFRLAWYAIFAGGIAFLTRVDGDVDAFLPTKFAASVQAAIDALGSD